MAERGPAHDPRCCGGVQAGGFQALLSVQAGGLNALGFHALDLQALLSLQALGLQALGLSGSQTVGGDTRERILLGHRRWR